MIRRGQSRRRRIRDAQRAAQRQLLSGRGDYQPPDRQDCSCVEWSYFTTDGAVRVRIYLWLQRGSLVDFAAILQAPGPEDDIDIERIDCAHGHVHLHKRNGDVAPLRRLDSADDVSAAFDDIDAVIEDRLRILREGGT